MGFTQPTDQTGTIILPLDPMLSQGLQDNGGPTWTIALLPGSPAIDKGTSNGLTVGVGVGVGVGVSFSLMGGPTK